MHDIIRFRGHRNVLSLHSKSLEVTRGEEISKRADCIIGVCASKGCLDLDWGIKEHIWRGGRMRFRILVNDKEFEFSGAGSRLLTLTDANEIVLRRSDYISERTGAINCSASAFDLPRKMVELLQDPSCIGELIFETC